MNFLHTEEYLPSDAIDLTFNMVSRLVTELLLENDEGIIVTAPSGKFFHDPNTSIEVPGSIKITISATDFTEKTSKDAVAMSGTFEDLCNKKHTFSLYFLIKGKKSARINKNAQSEKLIGRRLTLLLSSQPQKLYDSIFSLTCTRNSDQVAEGQGYLVFGTSL